MNGKLDVVKGRIKEAAGVLVNNKELRNEGKADQVAGKAKEVVEETVQKIKGNARKVINQQTITNFNGKLDIAKGRIKEAAGALVGDESLRIEGKADQVAGKAKEFVETTAQKIRDTARKTIDQLKDKAKQ